MEEQTNDLSPLLSFLSLLSLFLLLFIPFCCFLFFGTFHPFSSLFVASYFLLLVFFRFLSIHNRNLNFVRKCIKCNRIVAQLKKSVNDERDNYNRKSMVARNGITSISSGMSRRLHMDRITSCQLSQVEVVSVVIHATQIQLCDVQSTNTFSLPLSVCVSLYVSFSLFSLSLFLFHITIHKMPCNFHLFAILFITIPLSPSRTFFSKNILFFLSFFLFSFLSFFHSLSLSLSLS